jgi:hypothetical protein
MRKNISELSALLIVTFGASSAAQSTSKAPWRRAQPMSILVSSPAVAVIASSNGSSKGGLPSLSAEDASDDREQRARVVRPAGVLHRGC